MYKFAGNPRFRSRNEIIRYTNGWPEGRGVPAERRSPDAAGDEAHQVIDRGGLLFIRLTVQQFLSLSMKFFQTPNRFLEYWETYLWQLCRLEVSELQSP